MAKDVRAGAAVMHWLGNELTQGIYGGESALGQAAELALGVGDRPLFDALRDVKGRMHSGLSYRDLCAAHPEVFDETALAMIEEERWVADAFLKIARYWGHEVG